MITWLPALVCTCMHLQLPHSHLHPPWPPGHGNVRLLSSLVHPILQQVQARGTPGEHLTTSHIYTHSNTSHTTHTTHTTTHTIHAHTLYMFTQATHTHTTYTHMHHTYTHMHHTHTHAPHIHTHAPHTVHTAHAPHMRYILPHAHYTHMRTHAHAHQRRLHTCVTNHVCPCKANLSTSLGGVIMQCMCVCACMVCVS